MLKEEQDRPLKVLIGHLNTKTNDDAGGIVKTPVDTYREALDRQKPPIFSV